MPGMEITAETFRQLEESIDFRQQIALRMALGRNQLGLLPGRQFNCNGIFVRNTFEIERLQCRAILRSGKIIDIDGEALVSIPMLYGDEYYLAAGFSDEKHEFERNGIPLVSPIISYGIYQMSDLETKDLFPLKRFKVADGVFKIDEDYIVPSLFIEKNSAFNRFTDFFIQRLEEICQHSNLIEGDGKRTFLRYLFLMKSIKENENVEDYISLLQEIAQAVDYFIIRSNVGNRQDIPTPNFIDIEKWLKWFVDYLTGAISVLDQIVLEDNSIDYSALLEEAKKELMDKLRPELLETLPTKIRQVLYNDIVDKLKEFLPDYILEKIREQKIEISEELTSSLTPRLFEDLYEKLYNALYVAPEEEDEFLPMI